MKKVLLTGITGFLGSHTAIQLLEKDYKVIGTLRDKRRAEEIRNVIAKYTDKTANLELAEADLSNTGIWQQLIQGVDYIQHVASPFPREIPKDEDELILPAKNGVLAIMKAAAANGVKRVVITSSSGAVLYGKPKGQQSGTFDESTWTDLSVKADTTPYFRSKTIAEKAAWDFIATDKSGLELATVLPGAILGPILEDDFGTSANIVLKMMDGSIPAIPKIGLDVVDVRSVADLLVRAMEMPEAANQRYLGSAGFLTFHQITDILRNKYPEHKIPSLTLPDWLTRVFSWFDKTLAPVLLDLGRERKINNGKAVQQLHWQPIATKEAVLSCAESLLSLGLIK